jgi:DNA-binding CsgD family transcriptional regulator
MPVRHPSQEGLTTLRGRRRESELLDDLLEEVRSGHSRALVFEGEPGVGKSALLEHAIRRASGFRIARAAGIEAEMELAFAGLQQLCAPMLDRLGRLPAPQSDALGTAFGLIAGSAPDRFLIGLAALTLMSEAADEQPLLCVIDDVQWLDAASAQALAFVARRLGEESVGMLFTVREPSEWLKGLERLVVGGLAEDDARELLDSAITGPLDPQVRDRIIFEAHGNPLALLELPRTLSPPELAGGFGLPDMPVPLTSIEQSFQRRLDALPKESQLLLLVAAAEPLGDPSLLLRAARAIGLSAGAADPAVAAGLLATGGQVRFRHPLVRSTVYRRAAAADRQKAHAALAEATDPKADPDRRAWHRAHATTGPDEEIAAELERSADRAQLRGGLAAAAAFLERAVGLTPDPARRAQRALVAARGKHLAGAPDAALALLATAQAGPLDDLGRARVDLLRAQLAFAASRGRDPLLLLMRAAKRLEPLDAALARETYLDALTAAQFAGRLARNGGVREVAQAARIAPEAPTLQHAVDVLLKGLATRFAGGYAASVPMLKRALRVDPGSGMSSEQELRWMWLAGHAAVDLWEDRTWELLASRHLQLARDTGAITALPLALSIRIAAYTFAGELDAAAALIQEVEAAVEATGSELAPYGALLLAAWGGDESQVSRLNTAIVKEVEPRGEGLGLTITYWAQAVLYNGLGRHEEALPWAQRASEHPEDLGFSNWGLTELIVAAGRSGETDLAADALQRLTEMTHASGTDWALGVEARSRALLSEGQQVEGLYLEAIERLARTRIRVELARTHLQYGEWLRRNRRRVDAREQLRTAQGMFAEMGIEAFTSRADRELRATGERARKRSVETRDDLTAQELQIARLAGDGLSNPEIGARLFISPRTVEYHLHKVFAKLKVRSRSQLDHALATAPRAPRRS